MEQISRPTTWTTFNGRVIAPENLDHQHLSNIYWYHKLVFDVDHIWALDLIRERFNGQLRPYAPHIDFHHEITALEQKGYLQWLPTSTGEAITVGTIVYNNQTIGTIWKYNS